MLTCRYYYSLRPPGIGCQPDGFVEREMWWPKRNIPGDGEHDAFGWVEYPEPLPLETAWRYDLRPADPREKALYIFYLYADRNVEEMEWLIEDYTALTVEELQETGGHMAEQAIVLKQTAPEA